MIRITGLVLFALLTGCAATQNVTSSQIREPNSLRVSEDLAMSMAQIQGALFQYRYSCRSLPPLQIDPENKDRGLMMIGMPGITKESVGAIADFSQTAGKTKFSYYSYYSTWDSFGKEILAAIKDPSRCN